MNHSLRKKLLLPLFQASGLTYDALAAKIADAQDDAGVPVTVDTGNLWKQINGHVKPKAQALDEILVALDVPFHVYRDLMVLHGYAPRVRLPNARDIANACDVCQEELHGVPYPAYLVDCGQRLHAWNRYAPQLLGITSEQARDDGYGNATVLDLAFNQDYRAASRIVNGEAFLPIMVAVMRSEFQVFLHEPWCNALVTRYRRDVPGFDALWDHPYMLPPQKTATRTMGPLVLNVEGIGNVTFRLWGNDFIHDPRFRIVQYIPVDAKTLRACAMWVEQMTSKTCS